jgi:hypothetical protein
MPTIAHKYPQNAKSELKYPQNFKFAKKLTNIKLFYTILNKASSTKLKKS